MRRTLEQHNALMERVVEPEWLDWYRLTPEQRWAAQEEMWATFRFLGGSLEPECDSQSPFYDRASASWPTLLRSTRRV